MSLEDENIFSNPVYKALTTRVKEFEVRASQKGWILLIPQVVSLAPFRINSSEKDKGNKSSGSDADCYKFSMSFLHGHIIFPSPYLKKEYVTLNGDRIQLQNGRIHVIETDQAGKELEGVKILFDEMFYNDHGSYKAFCTSTPVISNWTKINKPIEKMIGKMKVPRFLQDGNEVFDDKRTIDEWMFVLNRDAKNGKALRFLESYADGILSSYVLVMNRVGIEHFKAKIASGVVEATKLLISCNPARFDSALSDKKSESIIHRVLESYLMTGVYSFVFSNLMNFYRTEYFKKSKSKNTLKKSTRAIVTAGKVLFEGETLKAIETNPLLGPLHKQQCPLGKLEQLREFIIEMSNSNGVECNADYVMSLLVQFVPCTQNYELSCYIKATLKYMTEFIVFSPNNELDFVLAQFQAAVEFVHTQAEALAISSSGQTCIEGDPNKRTPLQLKRYQVNVTGSSHEVKTLSGSINPSNASPKNENLEKNSMNADFRNSLNKQLLAKKPSSSSSSSTPNSVPLQAKVELPNEWGGFLEALKESSADVVASNKQWYL